MKGNQIYKLIGLSIAFLFAVPVVCFVGSAYNSNQVDVVFAFDTTGSMGSSINSMKANAINFANALAASGMDYRLGLTEFKDFPISCGGDCGDPGDFAYRTYNFGNLVSSPIIFNAWISSLRSSGGANTPESHLAVLHHTATDQRWRGDTVRKIVILISDAPPHADGNCCNVEGDTFANTKKILTSNSISVYIAGYDRGGSGVPDGWATDLATSTGGKFYPLGDLTPILKDITNRIQAIDISPQDPTTMKDDVVLNAAVKVSDNYKIISYAWKVKDVKTGNFDAEGKGNPFTYKKPGKGMYGEKTAELTITLEDKVTGKPSVITSSKKFKMFFDKGTAKQSVDSNGNIKIETFWVSDDGPGKDPNWYTYWKKDGAVPDMDKTVYVSDISNVGITYGQYDPNTNLVKLSKYAGAFYPASISLNTFFGNPETFWADMTGIDVAGDNVEHELKHQEITRNWNSGKEFCKNGIPCDSDSDRNLPNFDDQLPDWYEDSESHTSNTNTDTYDLENKKMNGYSKYGDQEYVAMRAGKNAKVDGNKDWANPGKQTSGTSGSMKSAARPSANYSAKDVLKTVISGGYSDEGIDLNGNSLYDYLRISANVDISQSNAYKIVGWLNDTNGNTIVSADDVYYFTSTGVHTMDLDFNGIDINRHGIDGPYNLSIQMYSIYSELENASIDSKIDVYKTSTYKYTDFEGQQANIADGFTDTAEDSNGDSILDNITIKVDVNVKKSGNYSVEGYLYGEEDNPIAFTRTGAALAEGLDGVELAFNGSEIAFGEWKGKYRLRYLSLYDEYGTRLGFELDPFQTKEYDANDFKSADARLNNFSDHGQDANGDGFFEYLNISVGINVSKAGNYLLEGDLYDSEGNETEANYTQMHLDIGKQIVPLMFKGKTIYTHGVNGAFKLRNLLLYDENSTIKDSKKDAYTTGEYSYAAFQPLILLTGNYSDTGEDTNGNALFNNLIVNVGLIVAKSGNVVAEARLLDPSGTEISTTNNTTLIGAGGSKVIQLRFDGQKIYKHGVNGPYLLSDLNIYHSLDPAFSEYANEVYTTSAYGYQEFENNTSPFIPSIPTGSRSGYAWVPYSYSTSATDPDGDQVKYTFNWGDGTTSTTNLTNSGTSASANHSWSAAGTYQVKAMATNSKGSTSGWSSVLAVTITKNNPPNTPSTLTGPTSGRVGTSYVYLTSATDPDGDQVKYTFHWDDGTPNTQTGLVNSGTKVTQSHAWSTAGTYQVKAMATDSKGATSGWSGVTTVTITTLPNTNWKSGSTVPGATNWQVNNANSIYVDVNTSSAGFGTTPRYFTSLGGTNTLYDAVGVRAIYSPTATGFRIYLRNWDGSILSPAQANGRNWCINWVGVPVTNTNSGSTTSGSTNWKVNNANSIYVDVNTASAGFGTTPRYFTSLGGTNALYDAQGVSAIYTPTATGFRIYLRNWDGSTLSPAQANSRNWCINWVGVPVTNTNSGSTTSGSTNWQVNNANSIYVDVNTATAGFATAPRYFTSLGGTNALYDAQGVNAIYTPTATGFRMYLRNWNGAALTPAQANSRNWQVQWLGVV